MVSSPVTSDPTNTPVPVIALFTPRYLPSNPGGMLLKKITELDVLKIENAITIKHEDTMAKTKPIVPAISDTETAGIITAKIRGKYAIVVDLSSPIFAITFGARKNTPNIVAI